MFIVQRLWFHQVMIAFLCIAFSFFLFPIKKEQNIRQLREHLGALRCDIERVYEERPFFGKRGFLSGRGWSGICDVT